MPDKPRITDDDNDLVPALNAYWMEADVARKGGLNPRDDKWRENLHLYWNRFDFSRKQNWQAREVMPEVPQYVDRFAAALKEALMVGDFYSVVDPTDEAGDLTQAVKRMTDVWLSRTGRNQMGTILDFASVFEEQMKMGALMACSGLVTWKWDSPDGRVAIEAVDPRFVWLDHTNRNLYRIRRVEIDRWQLGQMAKQKDATGRHIWNIGEINRLIMGQSNVEYNSLVSGQDVYDQAYKMEVSGHGQVVMTSRQPIVMDEYIATVVGPQGNLLAEKSLMVVANKRFLIRGPEPNPFWHGNDWMFYSPLVVAPLSVYGRSYMEDFGAISKTFNELTNLILDAVHTSSLNAWAVVPSMLMNPDQLAEGLTPNKMFLLEEGIDPKSFAMKMEMGQLGPDTIRLWQLMKNEISEAAGINEVGLGQFAPKGRTSATEVNETQQNSSALVRSLASTIEYRVLDPMLDLVWKTGLQHVRTSDKRMMAAAGPEMFQALMSQRRELVSHPLTFQARGISNMIRKSSSMKALLGVLQVVSGNPVLLQEFFRKVDPGKMVDLLMRLADIDVTKLQLSQREQMVRELTQPMQQQAQQMGAPEGSPTPSGAEVAGQHMQDLAKSIGILSKQNQPTGGQNVTANAA